jgi:oligopeptide/dipeptide ABC transporter ATP-binding protein
MRRNLLALLEVRDLHKTFGSGKNALPAVRGVDLDIERGQTVGLVGESGCGKTTLGRVVVGLQEPTSGQIRFDGDDIARKFRDIEYRRRVQMVFQHPMQSLNPRYRVGTTLSEPLKLLRAVDRSEIDDRVDEVLRLVGLGPEFRNRRPRQLSGGQQQRVAIARALISEPDLVVLDEPTSSLDQSVRGRIIALLRSIQEERDVAYLYISHDLSTVRRIASVVSVMYLGRIVEVARTEQVFTAAQHPYTKALLSAVPSMDPDGRRERIVLPGETPSPADLPTGCSFQDRCPLVHGRCRAEYPRLESIKDGIAVECFAVQASIEEPDRPTAGL